MGLLSSLFKKIAGKNDAVDYDSPEPQVIIKSVDYDETQGIKLELDWNDAFVNYLTMNGFAGASDEEIVQRWVATLYQDVVNQPRSFQ